MSKSLLSKIVLVLLLAVVPSRSQQGSTPLFDDPVLAKGKGVEVLQSELDEAVIAFKAARAAAGEQLHPRDDDKARTQLLAKLVAAELCLARATDADKQKGQELAESLIADNLKKVSSEASFKRQLLAMGTTFDKYKKEVTDEAIVKAVIDREVGKKFPVEEEEILKFYNDNPRLFEEPEGVRVRHILFATRSMKDGRPLLSKDAQAKKDLAKRTLERAKAGTDFTKLAQELSDDPVTKREGGMWSFRRGSGKFPPEFEAAAFSLQPGQLSDIVTTALGHHILKLEEKLPAKKEDFEKVHDRIREAILKTKIQKELPNYIGNLKKEAGLEIFGEYAEAADNAITVIEKP